MFGYRIQKKSDTEKIPDFGSQSPSLLNYVNNQFILLDINVNLVREQHIAVDVKADPFVKAIEKCINDNFSKKTLKKSLRKYYEKYQPVTALDLFNLNKKDAPDLANSKPWEAPYPWIDYSVSEWSKILKEVTKKENCKNGKSLTINDGIHTWGPVSENKLDVEVKRFHQLLIDINENGYKRNDGPDGDIMLDALCDENGDWRYINRGGTHRFSVLAGLGEKRIKGRIQSLIYKSDYEIWPNVLEKLYTKDGAIKLFEHFFNGNKNSLA